MARRGYWRTAAAQRVRGVAGLEDIDQAIAKIAEELVDGLVGPPTDLEGLASRVDIAEIRRDDTMLVPGELRKLQGALVVYLLPNLTKTRRRFTLAHELGHAFFEKTGRRPHPSRELERLCDKFAAEFLMPRRVFVSHAGSQPNLRRVRELCSEYSKRGCLRHLAGLLTFTAFAPSRCGTVKSFGAVRLSPPVLHQVRNRLQALSGDVGTEVVDLHERGGYSRWSIEWDTLGGDNHRVALLRPA